MKHLNFVLIDDVLVIAEHGQLSAQQSSVLDVIFQKVHNSDMPFGGVLILGSMDHMQSGAIEGSPFFGVTTHTN